MLSIRTALWLAGRLWRPAAMVAAEAVRPSRRRSRRWT
jgi:hypothetical protein